MGGFGSGKWTRSKRRKTRVEESLILCVRDVTKDRGDGLGDGSVEWQRASGKAPSIGYVANLKSDHPCVFLGWHAGAIKRSQFIRLTTTPTRFGRPRWWFECALVRDGVPCRRRAYKLYLPPNRKYFGCRECYDLTYKSSQTAHESERYWRFVETWPARTKRLLERIRSCSKWCLT